MTAGPDRREPGGAFLGPPNDCLRGDQHNHLGGSPGLLRASLGSTELDYPASAAWALATTILRNTVDAWSCGRVMSALSVGLSRGPPRVALTISRLLRPRITY